MKALLLLALLFGFISTGPLCAENSAFQIRRVLDMQIEAWNRGDIPGFVGAYAPDCTFVGKHVAHGRGQLLTHYQAAYPNREAMGHLAFSGVDVHLLSQDVATVTGEWHVDRPVNSTGGLFSLVFQRQAGEWKISLDHTS